MRFEDGLLGFSADAKILTAKVGEKKCRREYEPGYKKWVGNQCYVYTKDCEWRPIDKPKDRCPRTQ